MKLTKVLFLMKLADVQKYFTAHNQKLISRNQFKQYIIIDQTGPMAELTEENVFIRSRELRHILQPEFFREMECVVFTYIQEPRWLVEVSFPMSLEPSI